MPYAEVERDSCDLNSGKLPHHASLIDNYFV